MYKNKENIPMEYYESELRIVQENMEEYLGLDVIPLSWWEKDVEMITTQKGGFTKETLQREFEINQWKWEIVEQLKGLYPYDEPLHFFEIDCSTEMYNTHETEHCFNGEQVTFIQLKIKEKLKRTNKSIKKYISKKCLTGIEDKLTNYTEIDNDGNMNIYHPKVNKQGNLIDWGNK